MRVEMRKTGTSSGDGYVEQTTLYSDDSLPGTKGLNAAVQRRHRHIRVSCNGSLDSITSVSLSA